LKPEDGDSVRATYSESLNAYRFRLGERWFPGWQWPDHWRFHKERFTITVLDTDKFTFKPPDADISKELTFDSSTPKVWPINASLSTQAANVTEFNRALNDAAANFDKANKALAEKPPSSGQSYIDTAKQSIADAKDALTGLPPDVKGPLQDKLRPAEGQLATLNSKQADFVTNVGVVAQAQTTVQDALASADIAIGKGILALPGDKEAAKTDATQADGYLNTASSQLAGVTSADVKHKLSDSIDTKRQDLVKLNQKIAKSPDPVRPVTGGGGDTGDVDKQRQALIDTMMNDFKSLVDADVNSTPDKADKATQAFDSAKAFLDKKFPPSSKIDWQIRAKAIQWYTYLVKSKGDPKSPDRQSAANMKAQIPSSGANDPFVQVIAGIEFAEQTDDPNNQAIDKSANAAIKQFDTCIPKAPDVTPQDHLLRGLAYYYKYIADQDHKTNKQAAAEFDFVHIHFH
jgi:hypothetical protein